MSIISSPDEDGDISLKDSQSLVNVISLLAHHLEPDGQQVTPQNSDIQGTANTANVIFQFLRLLQTFEGLLLTECLFFGQIKVNYLNLHFQKQII